MRTGMNMPDVGVLSTNERASIGTASFPVNDRFSLTLFA